MKRLIYLARFFIVVPPMPLLMLAAFAVSVAGAVLVILVAPSRAVAAFTPVLLLQLFACASGFDVPARRGYYDLLLTNGESRRRVAIAHWVASALPGVTGWAVIAMIQRLFVAPPFDTSLRSTGTLCALWLVSTVPWAITVRLPRFSGAIGWLLAAAMVSATVPDLVFPAVNIAFEQAGFPGSLMVVVYPPLLVGRSVSGSGGMVVLPGLVLACGAMLLAIRSIHRRDIPLEAAQ